MLKRDKKKESRIAKERVSYLIKRAEEWKNVDYELARRYVELAKRIAMKYRVRIPKELKITYCKKCLYPYKAGKFRVRVRKGRVIIKCLNCGFERRIPIRPRRSSKKLKP
ncbi:MAG: ribonuclease P [Archaeoglobus sp.]|uniref:ribonuclease P protein component 4 n=1 Tax=Archaeoglobus sp. TaxID=1872626 RepID=UPI001D5C8E4A|nr:ribonuclease P protein component 4 [Archaeoglobus sp.]MBO8179912.1 ribonuclease P [Archaeoglobus sp.]